MNNNSKRYNGTGNNHNLRQNEIEKFMSELKEGSRELMHEHRLTQQCIEIVSGYNQSTIQRYLDPHDPLTPKIFFPMLLAEDEYTNPLAVYYVRALARSCRMELVPEVDRRKLNGCIEDEEREIAKHLGVFINEAEAHPEKRSKLLEILGRMKETVARAEAEILNIQTTAGSVLPKFLDKIHGGK